MSRILPEFLKLQYSAASIEGRISAMGSQISEWTEAVVAAGGGDVIGIPVLRGGIFFFADLVRTIADSIEIAPVRTWGYVAGEIGQQREDFEMHLFDLNPKGRSILLIDDLCDSGRTLKNLTAALTDLGAKEVRSAVLIKRNVGENGFDPDYVGFEYPGAEWFVGYGMELEDRYRNLPEVYIVQR